MMQQNFHTVPSTFIERFLDSSQVDVVAIIERTYLQHHRSKTVNPDSYFIRFPDKPNSRIIALPAAINGDNPVSGLKWISSYPDNIRRNLQRASAILVLNDYETGYPIACMEASQISAARTAASAVLAAERLSLGKRGDHLTVVGAGLIARTIVRYLQAKEWWFDSLTIVDLNQSDAVRLSEYAEGRISPSASASQDLSRAISASSHVILATTSAEPYIFDGSLFSPGQTILNISLRDLAPEIILNACNIVDDVDHCLKANTSPHLAEQLSGGRAFIEGTLAQVLVGDVQIDRGRPVIFSPFGLGVLDVALGKTILDLAHEAGEAFEFPHFFPNVSRW